RPRCALYRFRGRQDLDGIGCWPRPFKARLYTRRAPPSLSPAAPTAPPAAPLSGIALIVFLAVFTIDVTVFGGKLVLHHPRLIVALGLEPSGVRSGFFVMAATAADRKSTRL